MHGIAAPEDFEISELDGVSERRKFGGDFVGAEAMYESDSSGFVCGVEQADGFDEFVGCDGVSDFEADGVTDSAAIFDVSTVQIAGAITDPEHMSAEVVVTAGAFWARECLFVVQEECFVGGEEVDASELCEFAG